MPLRIERSALHPRPPILIDLPYPPGNGRTEAQEGWRQAAEAAIRRSPTRRMTCPVEILMIFRNGGGRRALGDLPAACLGVLVGSGLILGADSSHVRQLTVRFGAVPGVGIEIREAARNG